MRALLDKDRTTATRSPAPAVASWVLALLFAIGIAVSVYRIPIQVSDSLEIIQEVNRAPSVGVAFTEGLHASSTILRPLRQTQTKALLNVADVLGGRYHAAFRGYQALTVMLLIAVFTLVVRPRTWLEAGVLAFALTVLTGLQTFPTMLREAYPVNHFLLIALYCLGTLAVATSQGGRARGLVAVACLGLAMLTLESGALVLVVALAGYVAGLRGISRGTLIVMIALAAAYALLRIGYLDMTTAGLGERATGLGTGTISPEEQLARFGDNPLPLYAYTVTSAALSVLLSQPVHGEWTALAAWQRDEFRPMYAIDMTMSITATALCAWFLLSKSPANGRRRWREPIPFVALAVLGANAIMSHAYAKDEIVSTAGVFYAVVVYHAAAELLRRAQGRSVGALAIPALCVFLIACGWGFRSIGLHYKLVHAANNARAEWVLRMPPLRPAKYQDDTSVNLANRLREEALRRGAGNPRMLPEWALVYWGR
jgi:hypothetical protein